MTIYQRLCVASLGTTVGNPLLSTASRYFGGVRIYAVKLYGVGNSGGRAPPLMKRAECESCQSYRAVTYFRLNDAKGSNRSYASPQRLRSRPPVAVVDDIGVGQDRSMIIDLY